MDLLCQFTWRPRPSTLLGEEKIKEIRKNLKKYADDFDAKDRLTYSKLSKEMVEKRQRQIREYKELMERNRKLVATYQNVLMKLRVIDPEEDQGFEEEEYEFLVREESTEIE